MICGRIVNGEYVRVEEETGAPVKDLEGDFFKGVAPSDLSRLDNRQLYMASTRLHEGVVSGHGDVARMNEALNACYREARGRRATLR